MFAKLPSAFPKLQAVIEAMDKAEPVKRPPVEAIAQRLRKAYIQARETEYRSLSASQVRKLPYAYWVPREEPLTVTDSELVARYWLVDLPDGTTSGARRSKRWLTPLFIAYCEQFDPEDRSFVAFAQKARIAVSKSEGLFAERLASLHKKVAFFNPQQVPEQLAAVLIRQPGTLSEALAAQLLWPGFIDCPLGGAVLSAALSQGDERLRERDVIARLLEWARSLAAPVSKSHCRILFANALLRPWRRHTPPDQVKAVLVEFFVKVYGDPRMRGNRNYFWEGVSQPALGVMMNWLVGDTLRGFMRLLEDTADDTWEYRQKFWMAYYDKRHIDEAWLALGAQASLLKRRLQALDQGLGSGALEGAAPNQSVLLLKIGGLTFTEWSHSGSMRAYLDSDPDVPVLYQTHYHRDELRAATSLDFHDGLNQNPELRHMQSPRGTWQRKARDFIHQHTNVWIGDREILL